MSHTTKKIGLHRGRQRWQCNACGTKFQNHRRTKTRQVGKLWHNYVWRKQSLQELHQASGRSIPWIRQQLELYTPQPADLTPGPIVLIVDGFFFGIGVGMMLFRAANLHRNIYWFPINWETIADYLRGIDHLERQGWIIQAVVCDGRRGVKDILSPRYPIQMCHFHQAAIVRRYLTRQPLLPASQELAALTATLSRTTEEKFAADLNHWFEQWGTFLKERTTDPIAGRWHYTHRRIRSAYRSLRSNLPYLFTYKKYPHLGIPNTTNSLDGSISHLRDKLSAHRGIKLTQRIKITEELLKGIDPHFLH